MGWYPCCCSSQCSYCTGDRPDTVTVTITGATNYSKPILGGGFETPCTECDETFNATFVLDVAPYGALPSIDCFWLYDVTDDCDAYGRTLDIRMELQRTSTGWYLKIFWEDSTTGDEVEVHYSSTETTPSDCSDEYTLTKIYTGSPVSAQLYCSLPSTVTLNA